MISILNITDSSGKPAATTDLSIAHYNATQDYLYLNAPGDQTIRVFSLVPDAKSWNMIQEFEIGKSVNATNDGQTVGVQMEGSAIYMKQGM